QTGYGMKISNPLTNHANVKAAAIGGRQTCGSFDTSCVEKNTAVKIIQLGYLLGGPRQMGELRSQLSLFDV
ncbi:MAG TPA: hypothetical protein VHM64_22840, partial [Candidatus Binatia bacterium]|nr:hypothetical protein [Candidatus Binatia bacterium]